MTALACDVWTLVLTATSDAAWRFVTAEERARLAGVPSGRRRLQHAGGRTLMRAAVAHRTGQRPDTVSIHRRCARCGSREHGKPFAQGFAGHLSVSHSADLVVVAITDVAPVGVDVEWHQVGGLSATLARSLAGPGEAPAGCSRDRLRVWCRKEAVAKAAGIGLTRPLRDITIGAAAGAGAARGRSPAVACCDVDLPSVHAGYTAAVAVLARGELEPRTRDGSSLLDLFRGTS